MELHFVANSYSM